METEKKGHCETLMQWVRSWCTFEGWARGSYSLEHVQASQDMPPSAFRSLQPLMYEEVQERRLIASFPSGQLPKPVELQSSPDQDRQGAGEEASTSYHEFCSGVASRPSTDQRRSLPKYPPLPAESTTVDLTLNSSGNSQEESK